MRDSIHGNVDLEPWAFDLIDTREMQRLRRIRQLGTASLVYPGANHSRFEHSIGAYKLARDAARMLGLEEDEAQPVMAAALLHDLGHGPMSHLFEEVFKGRNQRHEEFTVDLVQWSTVGDRLGRHGIAPREVADLVLGRGPLGKIVSGDIDVDRMDYLLRDAHYCGVPSAVDPERLLSVMALHERRYVVREEGLTAAESLLLTRFLMYPSVYFHHTCRSAEAMIVAAIDLTLEQDDDLERLRVMDDAELMAALGQGPKAAAGLAARVTARNLHKRAYQGDQDTVERHPDLAAARDDVAARTRLRDELAADADVDVGEVLVDIPRAPLLREVAARVLGRNGEVRPMRDVSTITRTLLAAQMDHWRFWVFAPPEQRDQVAKACVARFGAPQRLSEPLA